jgi:hypothetical protein
MRTSDQRINCSLDRKRMVDETTSIMSGSNSKTLPKMSNGKACNLANKIQRSKLDPCSIKYNTFFSPSTNLNKKTLI